MVEKNGAKRNAVAVVFLLIFYQQATLFFPEKKALGYEEHKEERLKHFY